MSSLFSSFRLHPSSLLYEVLERPTIYLSTHRLIILVFRDYLAAFEYYRKSEIIQTLFVLTKVSD